MASVTLGMYLDMRNPPKWSRPPARHYGRWLERIVEAERLGADAVWLTEHHFFDDGYLPQCWTFAAAVAARTSRVRIGTAVTLLPLHSALETAEQVAVVDVISGGRMEAGFGVGYRKPEYRAFGGDFKRRYGVFAERVGELRRLWGEDPGAERAATPSPIQRPVPLWAGFNGPMGARTAGRLAMGLQSLGREQFVQYLIGLRQGGHDPSTARLSGQFEWLITDDPERAWAQIRPHVEHRWRSYNRYMFEGTSREHDPPALGDDDAMGGPFIIGTAAEVAARIRQRIDGLPVEHLYGWSDFPGLDDDLVDRHIGATFTELAPLLSAD